jgi:cyclopropane fatty-acyl-phospholipid synthase-like methyltransferase
MNSDFFVFKENSGIVTASYYNKWSNFQRDVANLIIENKELLLQDAKIVLDLGCGTGNMTDVLVKHLYYCS